MWMRKMKNRVRYCQKCGAKMIYLNKGNYKCMICENEEGNKNLDQFPTTNKKLNKIVK